MFKKTQRVDNGGWRFDWVNEIGDYWGGLRFYPDTGILSSWSRKPHKAAKENYHPYRINDHTWRLIRQACVERWGGEQKVVIKAPEPVKVEFEVEVGPNEWRSEEWCKKYGRCTVQEYAERNKCPIRQKG